LPDLLTAAATDVHRLAISSTQKPNNLEIPDGVILPKKTITEIIKLTETIEQELASQNFLTKNSTAKIVGKTNKKNLVFENRGKQIRITPEGQIL
jgi:DNA polymerase III sliding clamp (beta) subunit (PCNA family)